MSAFRDVLPLEREYQLRSILTARRRTDARPPIVHVAGWKTASQWVRMVFSDPQLMRATGYRATYVRGWAGAPGLRSEMLVDNTLATPVYIAADTDLITNRHRAFVVVREPVDLARSWLRTNIASHPSNVEVDARRRALNDLVARGAPALDVLAASLDDGFADTLRIAASWIQRAVEDDTVRISRFEDLTDPNGSHDELARIFDHVGFGQHRDRIDTLLSRYRKSRIAQVERLVRPATERKYGTGPGADAALQAALTDGDVLDVLHAFDTELVRPIIGFYAADGTSGSPISTGASA